MALLKQGESKALFVNGPPTGVRALFFGLLSIALMTVDHRQHHLESVRGALSLVVYPLQQIVSVPTRLVGWASDEFTSRDDLQQENRRLRQMQFLTEAQLQRLTVLEAENRRLRRLLGSAENLPERAIIAQLVSVDADPYRHRILVAKGTRDGAYVGQPLLDAHGVVGQIMHAGPVSSTALLITDPDHALPVQIDRTGMRGVVLGSGIYGELELPYVPNNSDVQVGDLLITSGLGGRFPAGYPVAKVARVERDRGRPFARIVAHPTAALDRIREVLLLDHRASLRETPGAPSRGDSQDGGVSEIPTDGDIADKEPAVANQ